MTSWQLLESSPLWVLDVTEILDILGILEILGRIVPSGWQGAATSVRNIVTKEPISKQRREHVPTRRPGVSNRISAVVTTGAGIQAMNQEQKVQSILQLLVSLHQQ